MVGGSSNDDYVGSMVSSLLHDASPYALRGDPGRLRRLCAAVFDPTHDNPKSAAKIREAAIKIAIARAMMVIAMYAQLHKARQARKNKKRRSSDAFDAMAMRQMCGFGAFGADGANGAFGTGGAGGFGAGGANEMGGAEPGSNGAAYPLSDCLALPPGRSTRAHRHRGLTQGGSSTRGSRRRGAGR